MILLGKKTKQRPALTITALPPHVTQIIDVSKCTVPFGSIVVCIVICEMVLQSITA